MATGLLLFVCLFSISHVFVGVTGTDDECLPDMFRCAGSGRCLTRFRQCDGNVDCPDGSDEGCRECPYHDDFKRLLEPRGRLPDYIKCDGIEICVPPPYQCDGYNFCPDGKDETDCWSKECFNSTFLRCDSGSCYPSEKHCDGIVDCPVDDLDERFCTQDDCPLPNLFEFCGPGSCINEKQRCDGVADCHDQSDESGCGKITFCLF
ncbi:PREDICTED: low-density lipoprotein receptor-like [Branchiostoma belcheri]|uniref:Low-density lipoprotein receptor-like n=1 Tax=Branchiostoma belcheri TaxID=7741 RepID=A0A6P4ZZ73_BRABE|nr:PREDICTED: low-density lipoprotein receptor-like [Branchiostoma belcheri]